MSNKAEDVRKTRNGVTRKAASDDKIEKNLAKVSSTPRDTNLRMNAFVGGKTEPRSKPMRATPAKVSSTGTKLTSRDVTSSRVTREQYFPKKYPFSSRLHENAPKPIVNTKPKVRKIENAPSAVKPIPIKKSAVKIERPRTATIHKAPEPERDRPSPSTKSSDEYEDDFDSYESDFEQCTSSSSPDTSIKSESDDEPRREDERKLDSGTYDMPDVKHRQILDGIREAIERENADVSQHKSLASLSDEGFEESTKLSLTAPLKPPKRPIVNKRGEELMRMICLDSVAYSLFDMRPLPYNEFMNSYGRAGTFQASVQTGDDDVDDETQTEPTTNQNKWTQYPVKFSTESDYLIDTLGVGNDPPTPRAPPDLDTRRLQKFIVSAGKLIVNILEQCTDIREELHPSTELPFCDSYFKLNVEPLTFLNGRSVTHIAFHENLALTVHEGNIQVYMNQSEQMLARPLVIIWNVLEPSSPKRILASSADVTDACFDRKVGFLVFAGCVDGTMSLWDLRESINMHRETYSEDLDEHIAMQVAAYTTALEESDEITQIVALQLLTDESDLGDLSQQVCALDEIGNVMIWSVIENHKIVQEDVLSPWGHVSLVKSHVISMQSLNPNLKGLQCYDMKTSRIDSLHLYLATNYGVLHCLTNQTKPNPKIYKSKTDLLTEINCLEMCPFSERHFLVGSCDGTITLYSRQYTKSLMDFKCVDDSKTPRIDEIQWSITRPTVFYVKDAANNVHAWDLTTSDLYPVHTVRFKENITSMKLSPVSHGWSFLAVTTEGGKIYMYSIERKYNRQSNNDFNTELKKFLNYVNRL